MDDHRNYSAFPRQPVSVLGKQASTTWLVLLLTLCGFAFGVGACLWNTRQQDGLRRNRMDRLYFTWAAAYAYNAYHRHLPPAVIVNGAGQECHSWRSALIDFGPSIGRRQPPDLTVPWTDKANATWAGEGNFLYCFSESPAKELLETSVVAVVGEGTVFGSDIPMNLFEVPDQAILFIELADSKTHWMAPGDFDISNLNSNIVKGRFGTGLIVTFADGNTWALSPSTPLSAVGQFMKANSARQSDREQLLGRYCLDRIVPSLRR